MSSETLPFTILMWCFALILLFWASVIFTWPALYGGVYYAAKPNPTGAYGAEASRSRETGSGTEAPRSSGANKYSWAHGGRRKKRRMKK